MYSEQPNVTFGPFQLSNMKHNRSAPSIAQDQVCKTKTKGEMTFLVQDQDQDQLYKLRPTM